MIERAVKEDLVFLPAARRTVIWSHLSASSLLRSVQVISKKQASLLLDLSGQQICQDRYDELVVAFALPVNIYSRYRDLFPGQCTGIWRAVCCHQTQKIMSSTWSYRNILFFSLYGRGCIWPTHIGFKLPMSFCTFAPCN